MLATPPAWPDFELPAPLILGILETPLPVGGLPVSALVLFPAMGSRPYGWRRCEWSIHQALWTRSGLSAVEKMLGRSTSSPGLPVMSRIFTESAKRYFLPAILVLTSRTCTGAVLAFGCGLMGCLKTTTRLLVPGTLPRTSA